LQRQSAIRSSRWPGRWRLLRCRTNPI